MGRFGRWLANDRIDVQALYGPLLQRAPAEWGTQLLYLALDTSMLWDVYCLVGLSLVHRGRAISIVWTVLDHASSSIAYEVYKGLLENVTELLPFRCPVVLPAHRGVADTHLMAHLARLGWHWRIRIKGSFWSYRPGERRCKVKRIPPGSGKALLGCREISRRSGDSHRK